MIGSKKTIDVFTEITSTKIGINEHCSRLFCYLISKNASWALPVPSLLELMSFKGVSDGDVRLFLSRFFAPQIRH